MRLFDFITLAIGIAIASPASAKPQKIEFPIKINRYAYTGEHFMVKDAESKPLFEKLLFEGKLLFKDFIRLETIDTNSYDWGSKNQIGYEIYILSFASPKELHDFVKNRLIESAPYNMVFSTLSYGILIGVRDYAIESKDIALMKILLDKTKGVRYTGSANEGKAKIYEPIREALANEKK